MLILRHSNARFRDDPSTHDTGAGPAPIADIGALERQDPSCRPDFNRDGELNSQDYFDFLGAFLDGSPVKLG